MALGERIRQLRERKGWSQRELSEKTGLSRSRISLIELGINKHPELDAFLKFAHIFAVPLEELYEASGYGSTPQEKYKEDKLLNEINEITQTLTNALDRLKEAYLSAIPLYGKFHAGAIHEEPLEYIYWPGAKPAGENIQAFRVEGHCLGPKIENGDVAIINRDLIAQPGDIVLCVYNSELVCGQVRYNSDKKLCLVNKEEHFNLNQCQAVAVIIGVYKKFK